MLKAIKLGFLLIAATAFVAGCASTSETETTETEVETTSSTADSSAASSSSSSDSSASASTPPPPPAPPVEEAPRLQYKFFFEFDSSTLTEEARAALLAHAAVLKANPRAIRLSGHADERGTREYNIALGERRALAVRNFLRFEGVTSPIEVVSYGEERPTSFASTEEAYALNRRVELN